MFSLTEDILIIVKQHDDWQNSVEIKENSKGEPAITIKTRSDGDLQDLIDLALEKYKAAKDKITSEAK